MEPRSHALPSYYIPAPELSEKNFCDGLEIKLASSLGGIYQAYAPETDVKSVTTCFYLRLMIISGCTSRARFSWCEALAGLIQLWSHPLTLLRIVVNRKALINLHNVESEVMDSFQVRSIKMSKSLLECRTIIAFDADCDAKALVTGSCGNRAWLLRNRLLISTDKPTGNIMAKYITKQIAYTFP